MRTVEAFVEYYDRESDPPAMEQEANDFAGALLIPPTYDDAIRTVKTTAQARGLAQVVGVAPGIVAGRVQRDTQDWKFGSPDLLEKYEIVD